MKNRPTSYDVAKLANVSRTTVSLVLNNVKSIQINESTRQRVVEAAIQLNYIPDITGRRLASGKSFNLGLVVRLNPEEMYSDALLLKVLLGVEQAAEQADYHVLFKPLSTIDFNGYSQLILGRHVDGIVLAFPREDDREIIRIQAQGFPVILIGQLPGFDIPYVAVDDLGGAKEATKHLIEQGHTHIGMITNASLKYISTQQRIEGYRQALIEAGITPKENLISYGSFNPSSGFYAMQQLLNLRNRLTAVFIANDSVAIGAIRAIKQQGLSIPDDIALVGFNDIPMAEYIDPPLSTIRLPATELGEAAARNLCKLVAGESLEQSGIQLSTNLVVRSSSVKALSLS
jgi:DNA-binding LacI/PurR family transcriptional regulator